MCRQRQRKAYKGRYFKYILLLRFSPEAVIASSACFQVSAFSILDASVSFSRKTPFYTIHNQLPSW